MKTNTGYNIRQIRKSLNISQEEFANKLNISRSTIQHWENNYTEPNLDALRKMKQVFGVSYDEIIDGF